MNRKNLMLDWLSGERRATLMHKEDGRTYIESRQDAEPIIEFVKDMANAPQDKDFKYLGTVPMSAVNNALVEGWANDPKAWRKYLRENAKYSANYHKV